MSLEVAANIFLKTIFYFFGFFFRFNAGINHDNARNCNWSSRSMTTANGLIGSSSKVIVGNATILKSRMHRVFLTVSSITFL